MTRAKSVFSAINHVQTVPKRGKARTREPTNHNFALNATTYSLLSQTGTHFSFIMSFAYTHTSITLNSINFLEAATERVRRTQKQEGHEKIGHSRSTHLKTLKTFIFLQFCSN